MVVGTSTGGITALGLGAGRTATELLKLYMERGGEVFPDHPPAGPMAPRLCPLPLQSM
jgi:patatin-like phospholipase/acyl hydrolase